MGPACCMFQVYFKSEWFVQNKFSFKLRYFWWMNSVVLWMFFDVFFDLSCICTAGADKVGACSARGGTSLSSTWVVAVGGEGVETDLASRSCGVRMAPVFFSPIFRWFSGFGWMGRFFLSGKGDEEIWWKIISPRAISPMCQCTPKSRLSRETSVMAIWRKRSVAGWSWFQGLGSFDLSRCSSCLDT